MFTPTRRATGRPYPTTCGVCGKIAIYNRKGEGRCSPHRDVLTAGEAQAAERMAARQGLVYQRPMPSAWATAAARYAKERSDGRLSRRAR